jgi:hypothetical protein
MRYCCEEIAATKTVDYRLEDVGLVCGRYEADHSPTSAEVKKTRIYISTPPYTFMA